MTAQFWAIGLAFLGGLSVLLLISALGTYRRDRVASERRDQVLRYANLDHGVLHETSDQRKTSRAAPLDVVLTWLRVRERISIGLDRAGIGLTPAQWAGFTLVGFGFSWLAIAFVTRSFWMGLILALVVAGVVPRLIVARREAKRRREFEIELPAFFLTMASALRSGLSFPQALGAVASDGVNEVNRQMRRVVTEVSLGVPPDQALASVADRMQSEDLRWAVFALSIQKEVGGNLSAILDSIAETVRTRSEINREVHTLSAEGRLSAGVLVALPVVIFALLALLRPDYVSIFWTTSLGRVLLVVTGALFTLGIVWMRSIVRVRV